MQDINISDSQSVNVLCQPVRLQSLNEHVENDCLTSGVKLFEHLLQLRIQLYRDNGKQDDLLLIRAMLMFYKHPKLCVRNGQWDLLVEMAAREMDDVL
jgi:hypothetical protein